MKLMITSDIHGSAYYCEKLLTAFQEGGFDRLLLLGDTLYHGPRNDLPAGYSPKDVANMLNGIKDKVFAVRGNCDADVDQAVLEFPILAKYAVFALGDKLIYASHGHVFSPSHLPPLRPGDVFLFGHIHVPVCELQDGITVLNPGSVSIPKENSPHSYIAAENGSLSWIDLETGKSYKSAAL